MDHNSYLLELPQELIDIIYSNLDPATQITFHFTCKSFNKLAYSKVCQKKKIMSYVYMHNSIELVKWFVDYGCKLQKGIYQYKPDNVGRYCSIDTIKQLVSIGYKINKGIIREAARFGRMDIIQYFVYGRILSNNEYIDDPYWTTYGLKYEYNKRACLQAALGGNIDIIMLFTEGLKHIPDMELICLKAVKGEYKHIIKYMIHKGYEPTSRLMEEAAAINSLDMMKWIYGKMSNKNIQSKYVYQHIFTNNNVEMFNWIKDKLTPKQSECSYISSIEMLKAYHRHGFTLYSSIIDDGRTNIDMVKYAKKHGCKYNSNKLFKTSLYISRLDIVDWLLDNGYKYRESDITKYVNREKIKLDTIKYIVDKNLCCKDTILNVVMGNTMSIKIIEYALNNGAKWRPDIYYTFIREYKYNGIRWALSKGYPSYGDLYKFIIKVSDERLNMVKLLYEYGIPINIDLCYYAVLNNDLGNIVYNITRYGSKAS